MSSPHYSELMKKLIDQFYKRVTRTHSRKGKLSKELDQFITKVDQNYEQQQNFHLTTIQPKKTKNIEVQNQFQSLRVTNTSSSRNLQVSRTKLSRKSDSSRQLSQNQSKYFGCDWVYSSPDASRTVMFAIIASYMLTDSKFGFKLLEDRVNDYLGQHNAINPFLMINVTRQWQRVVEMVSSKIKSSKWQRTLKEVTDKMPIEFTNIVYLLILGRAAASDGFSNDLANKLSKEGKVTIVNFIISYRQIQKVQKMGKFNMELAIGFLTHSKNYVVANKTPDYSQEQMENRQIKMAIHSNIEEMLRQMTEDQQTLGIQEFTNYVNEKERIVKDYFQKKLAEVTID